MKISYLSGSLLSGVTFDNKKGCSTVLYRSPSQNSSEFDYFVLHFLKKLSETNSLKPDFLMKIMKINNSITSAKTYWLILKPFYNGCNFPLKPNLLIDNNFASDFANKGNLCNEFFASQCIPITNSSVSFISKSFKTDLKLNTIKFEEVDIFQIIRDLNVNKAHGHDDTPLKMLKICNCVETKAL